MYQDRIPLYRQLEEKRNSKVIALITGDRRNLETQIHSEQLDYLTHHLDKIGNVDRISLFLYTRGGETMAARGIANLIRQYCEEYEVVVPAKAHSAGTLICLGASKILMTKQATLGPIDPSINTPLNPLIEDSPGPVHARMSVSVEAINGYIDLAKKAGITECAQLAEVFTTLSEHVHPLVLGQVYRTRIQIRMIGRSLLKNHTTENTKADQILDFLCSESGSHDYTIYWKEAKNDLGLTVEEPDNETYPIIRAIYEDLSTEMELTTPFEPQFFLGTDSDKRYEFHRAIIEGVESGSDCFLTQGIMRKHTMPQEQGLPPQEGFLDQKIQEGWFHANP